MKRKIILITLICLLFIISSLIGILFIKKVKGSSQDIDYIFENDVFIKNPKFNNTIYNVRNSTIIIQNNYTSTYDFLTETSERIIPNEWINSSTSGYIEIIDNYIGHNKVIKMNDDDINQVSFYQSLSNIGYGSIEYWFLNTDMTSGRPMIWLFHGSNELFRVYLREGLVKAYNGAFQNCGYAKENAWIHIKIEFECTLGNYKGLDQYKFNVFNGNVKYGSFSFINNELHIDKIEFVGTSSSNSYYIDALGYSWNDYTIGQNIVSLNITTNSSILEVDKYEFAYETFIDLYDIGYDNPSNWTDIESGGDDDTNIVADPYYGSDRMIYMEQLAPDIDDTGIEKDFNFNSGIINITWSVNLTVMNGLNEFCTKIYSYDDTLISDIYIENTQLKYFDGSYEVILANSLSINLIYDFILYINQEYGISLLKYYENNIYQNTFTIPLLDYTKKGLGKVKFYIDVSSANNMKVYLDNVGIYINGTSQTSEFAYMITDILTSYPNWIWYFSEYNLFSFNVLGNCSFHVSTYYWIPDIIEVSRFNPLNYYNESQLFNLYDLKHESESYCNKPRIWIEFYGQLLNSIDLTIEGVKLIEGSNEYNLKYSHNGIDTNKSYFYVLNNRLYFNHIANQNDTLEYIQAKFEIDNTYAINRSISFKTYFLGISKAYFITNYVSQTDSIFLFKLDYETINMILPQQQIIKSFTILITDNDNNDYYGKSEGYISSITLIYYPDIELTILTLSLVEIIIPLIIIIIPTIAIASVYGKKAILPMLMLMSIICFATNIIPIEIFFIIIIALGSGMFLQYKKEREKI